MNSIKTLISHHPPGADALAKTVRHGEWSVLFGLCLFLAGTADTATAQTVVARARLGNNTEDIEFIHTGRYANHIAIIDGYDVLAVPAIRQGRDPVQKLFDVKKLPLSGGPRGIAYVESERLFVFTDVVFGNQLFFTDENGAEAGIREITFPVEVSSAGSESVSYIRRGSPFYPDHLLLVIYAAPDYSQRIEVVRRDGVVVSEIVPEAAIQEHGCASACYLGSGRLLVSTFDGLVFLMDTSGRVVAGPSVAAAGESCEGAAQLADGRLAIASYTAGKVLYFDEQLNRLPEADRDYKIGIGISRPLGPAWNSATDELLFLNGPTVDAVPATLNGRRTVLDLAADGIDMYHLRDVTYLPDENRIGVGMILPHQIVLYGPTGLREDVVDLSRLGGPTTAQYLPSSGQFGLWLRGWANRGLLQITDRRGARLRTIDLRPFGVNLGCFAPFDPAHASGGRFLVMDALNDTMLTLDFAGNVLSRTGYREALELPMVFGVTAITTGSYAGAFAAVNGDNSEVVIFTLP